jgi:hypothetical protein
VPRAYHILGPTEEWKREKIKIKEKYKHLMQNKVRDFKNTFFKNQNSTISLRVKCDVRKTHFSVCLAKGTVGV